MPTLFNTLPKFDFRCFVVHLIFSLHVIGIALRVLAHTLTHFIWIYKRSFCARRRTGRCRRKTLGARRESASDRFNPQVARSRLEHTYKVRSHTWFLMEVLSHCKQFSFSCAKLQLEIARVKKQRFQHDNAVRWCFFWGEGGILQNCISQLRN